MRGCKLILKTLVYPELQKTPNLQQGRPPIFRVRAGCFFFYAAALEKPP
jgi:hypothetical protein